MFRRKLAAVDYQNYEKFNVEDEAEVRNLVVWLEDQKIRHYKIEDRAALRSGAWPESLHKYLTDVGCPAQTSQTTAWLDWLLGFSVRLEYGDNVDKYRNVTAAGAVQGEPKKSTNPLDSMHFESPDFKAGVMSLAGMLQIPPHDDHNIVLQAVCVLIKEKFGREAVERAEKSKGKPKPKQLPLDQIELGFETGDYISAEAAKILRLLHIRDLRTFQNRINEAIVQVQALTANPKTDSRLGKVGR